MASWMIHLRIADILLDEIDNLPQAHFVVGNIAPDSGEPNEDWSVFTPSTNISHWKLEGVEHSQRAEFFRQKYLNTLQSPEAFAFYLGYYTHLVTDYIWSREIYLPQREKYAAEFAADSGFIWKIKQDMYDLDHLYLRENPDFRAYTIFSGITTFPNVYLDYFSLTAFEKKMDYITGFYNGFDGDLDRAYPYMTKDHMHAFVDLATKEIRGKFQSVYL